MKDMTWGTFIACMFCAFMIGFLACHKLYSGLNRFYPDEVINDISNLRRNNPSLHGP
jgi:hypothetical protein